ncbi:MAG: acyl-CoA dehydrogenase family protein [Acidimicrobiales bacterium]
MSSDDHGEDTPDQAEFRGEAREFLRTTLPPRRDANPWSLNFTSDEGEARAHFESGRAWQRLLFDNHFAGLTYPPEYGGRGGESWHERIFREELAHVEAPTTFISATIAMLGPTLMRHGTDEQRAEYLPRLLSGDDAWCQLFSEPGAGSDLAGLACRADRDGDHFLVNGQKVWNSAAQFCDRGMLLVRTNPDVPKHHGITFLLVDMDSPGVEVRPLVQATGSAHFNEVFLADVSVPASRVLGQIDEGWSPARTVMSNEAAFIGGGNSAGNTNEKLVMLARAFGAIDDPTVRQDLARHYTRERLLAIMGEQILAAVRQRKAPPMDPSILKLFVAENRVLSGNLAMAMAGAAGLVTTDERSAWIQAELVGRYGISIGGGTNEVQRNNLAERALGLPREPSVDRELAWREIRRS